MRKAATTATESTATPDLVQLPGDTILQLMKYEDHRRASFSRWPVKGISTSEMAAAGFFYFYRGDTVVCPFCMLQASGWRPGDVSLERHRRASPNCPYIRGKDCGNVPRAKTDEPRPMHDIGLTTSAANRSGDLRAPVASQPDYRAPSGTQAMAAGRSGELVVATREAQRDAHDQLGMPAAATATGASDIMTAQRASSYGGGRGGYSGPSGQQQAAAGVPSFGAPSGERVIVPQSSDQRSGGARISSAARSNETQRQQLQQRQQISEAGSGYYANLNNLPGLAPEEKAYLALMKNEANRLESFNNWPFPEIITAQELAAAGFYYAGEADYASCPYCAVTLAGWEPGDDALTMHMKRKPECSYLDELPLRARLLENAFPGAAGKHSDRSSPMRQPETSAKPSSMQRKSPRKPSSDGADTPVAVPDHPCGRRPDAPGSGPASAPAKPMTAPVADVHQTIGVLPSKDSDPSCAPESRGATRVVHDEVDGGHGFAGNDTPDTGHGRGRIDTVAYADSLKSEECRRQTFQNVNWPSFDNWPIGHRVTPHGLAAAGLYYTGHGDFVRCAFCRRTLSQWEPTDDPWNEHNRLYPDCVFKGGATAGNVPMQQNLPPQSRAASAASSQPLRRDLRDVRARLATFEQLSAAARRSFPPIESVAEAGFYVTEGAGDSTVCFWCGGTLRCWSSGENPWMEHARWFPECEFVKKVKGADFILSVKLLFADAHQPHGVYHSASEMAQGQEPARAYDIAPGEERLPLHVSSSLEARTAFELLSNVGITREQIQTIARQQRQQGQQHVGNVESMSREEPRRVALSPNQQGAAHSQTSEEPLRRDLSDVRSRLATFGRMSAEALRNFPPIESVAQAGFYLTEGAGDSTVCFWCGGSQRMNCWSSGENPWMAHARWFPECGFVRKVKGADFVLSVSAPEMARGQEPVRAYDIAPGEERLTEFAPLHVSPSLEARTAFELLSNMGITREHIQAIARQQRQQRQQHVGNVESMSRDEPRRVTLNLNQQVAAHRPVSEVPSPSLPSVTEQHNVVSLASNPEHLASMEIEQPGPSDAAGALVCWICRSGERQRAFVPCGHFVACENCAQAAPQCPTCGCEVRGTYRVYVP